MCCICMGCVCEFCIRTCVRLKNIPLRPRARECATMRICWGFVFPHFAITNEWQFAVKFECAAFFLVSRFSLRATTKYNCSATFAWRNPQKKRNVFFFYPFIAVIVLGAVRVCRRVCLLPFQHLKINLKWHTAEYFPFLFLFLIPIFDECKKQKTAENMFIERQMLCTYCGFSQRAPVSVCLSFSITPVTPYPARP